MKKARQRGSLLIQKKSKPKRQLIFLNMDDGYYTFTIEPICPFKTDVQFQKIKQSNLDFNSISIAVKLQDIIKLVFYTNHRIYIHWKVCKLLTNNKTFTSAMNRAILKSEDRMTYYLQKEAKARKIEYRDQWSEYVKDEKKWNSRIMEVKSNILKAAK